MIKSILKGVFIGSFFFISSLTFAFNVDTVEPKTSSGYPLTCAVNVWSTYKSVDSTTQTNDLSANRATCSEAVIPLFCSIAESNGYNSCSFSSYNGLTSNTYTMVSNANGNEVSQSSSFTASVGALQESKECPPDSYPDYIYPIYDETGELSLCDDDNPALQQCDEGFYKFAVGGQCVPIDCPPAGTQDTIWASGSAYTNQTGTYCDGTCAFSTSGGQNDDSYSGEIALRVVSTGAVCGQDPTQDWFSEGNEQDNCTTTVLSTGANAVSCSNGNDDTGLVNQENIDLTEQKDSDILELNPVQETCDPTDAACAVRNMQEQLKTENQELKTEQQELHNKQIEAQEKTTINIVKAIQDLQKSTTIGNKLVTEAIKADNGSGASGGGSSDVTINSDGAGLTDNEIGEAFGGLDDVISSDIVTLSDYSAPYSGWLPAGACPAKKTFDITIKGTTTPFELEWQPVCDIFSLMGYLLMASATIAVALMIQRSL